MGDYDIDGTYNPQLASPVPLDYIEPEVTPEDIESDNISTDQVAQMYCRILELQKELADTKDELQSLAQFTSAEIGKLPEDYVKDKQS